MVTDVLKSTQVVLMIFFEKMENKYFGSLQLLCHVTSCVRFVW